MLRQHLQKKMLPDTPGVYFFLAKNRKILYIGRATSLKSRVRSYFNPDLHVTRGPQIVEMVSKASKLDFKKTDSVLEAIILEADLIKKFQPYYNTKEKDDKSFNCVVITKEEFPKVFVIRKKDMDPKLVSAWYGPFPSGGQLRDAMKIIRRIFPFRDAKCLPYQVFERQKVVRVTDVKGSAEQISLNNKFERPRPCFNRQIGLCPGVCTGEVSKQEYSKTISNIKLFFSGKKNLILRNLEKEMKIAAKNMDFERAQEIKKTLFALQHIQDVSLLRSNDAESAVADRTNAELRGTNDAPIRIESYDVAHISGTDVVGVMTVVEDGFPKKSDYRKFKIRGGFGNNDVASLKEVIERRLNHSEWPLPTIFVADGGVAQKSTIEGVLRVRNISKDVVAVTKNDKHRPEKILGDATLVSAHEKVILLANAEAHRFALAFHRKRRTQSWK